jgi:hypothetical protein
MKDWTMGKVLGATWEIVVDGKPLTYRDVRDVAFETAKHLKYRNPNSLIVVRDLQTADSFPVLQGRL